MPISKTLLAGSLAGAALLLSAGAALADPAQATGAVNVRSGPGVNYSVVDQLYRGENVDVGECDGGWCQIDHSGRDGWVSANYLSPSGDYAPPPPPPVYYEQEPEYVPAPIYINPPGYYDRRDFRRHYPHRPYPGKPYPPGSSPPPAGAPPPVQHQHFPPGYGLQFKGGQVPSTSSPPKAGSFPPGYGRQFRTQPSGQAPAVAHPQRPAGNDFCTINPSAPICSGGGSGSGTHHQH